eukprot:comp76462_c0_seq1/m.48256 comp76462_c0_seq1/g.48256  ORF comp76462_c0_seq1/g.48256 comp76462_c0_seq1/m.48256 type:complete len:415 (-) comp76462_c0_seq1:13-1257(-)
MTMAGEVTKTKTSAKGLQSKNTGKARVGVVKTERGKKEKNTEELKVTGGDKKPALPSKKVAEKKEVKVSGQHVGTKRNAEDDHDKGKKPKKAKLDTQKKAKVNTRPKPVAQPPQKPTEISSNWKMLQQTLSKNKPVGATKRKPRPLAPTKTKTVVQEEETQEAAELWFDDIDPALVERELGRRVVRGPDGKEKLVTGSFNGRTKHLALDCEMVGVGPEGDTSVLARVAVVNAFGVCLLDMYVKPKERVTDYRTHVSGILPEHLEDAEEFESVQKEVYKLTDGCVLVGHALQHDLKALLLAHPRKMIRDTSTYPPFRQLAKGSTPSLRKLAKELLGITIQEGEHTPVEDAQAAMLLYKRHETDWELHARKVENGLASKERKEKKARRREALGIVGDTGDKEKRKGRRKPVYRKRK